MTTLAEFKASVDSLAATCEVAMSIEDETQASLELVKAERFAWRTAAMFFVTNMSTDQRADGSNSYPDVMEAIKLIQEKLA